LAAILAFWSVLRYYPQNDLRLRLPGAVVREFYIKFFDEMLENDQSIREPYSKYGSWLEKEDPSRIHRKAAQAEAFFRKTGITFNVYGEDEADERLIPFDVVPRIISAREWRKLSKGGHLQ
jgi:uncharacterized circularly permuted ATP-grasp superfamily protein